MRLIGGLAGVALVGLLAVPQVQAAGGPEVMAPIKQFIDGFNKGDTKSAFAAYALGEITIVDEFAPHRWTGPNAAHAWAAEYEKHALATGIRNGAVTYKEPTRAEIEGKDGYVIVPTVYTYLEHATPMVEEGQMTFVLHLEGGVWKLRGWTWSGVKPHVQE